MTKAGIIEHGEDVGIKVDGVDKVGNVDADAGVGTVSKEFIGDSSMIRDMIV